MGSRSRWMILAAACMSGCRSAPPASIADRPFTASPTEAQSLPSRKIDSAAEPPQPAGVRLAAHIEPVDEDPIQTEPVVDSSAWERDRHGVDASELVAGSGEVLIDLGTALALVSGRNQLLALARARTDEAMARLDQARALKLPTIRAGMNYNKHEGRLQDIAGRIIDTSRGSIYSGLGAGAVGAGSPIQPGIVSQFHVVDAVFQPRIAAQAASAQKAAAQAVMHDQMMATAIAHTELVAAHQTIAVLEDAVARSEQLAATTAEFASVGQGLLSDRDRAASELALRRLELQGVEETAALAAVRLTELLHCPSDEILVPAEARLAPIEWSDASEPLGHLVATGLNHRPELSEARHWTAAASEKLRREQQAFLMPSVLLALSYGGLAGGLGSDLSNYGDRLDADALASWELRNAGAGERAAQREAASQLRQARIQALLVMDRVAREVREAAIGIEAKQHQIEWAGQAAEAARSAYANDWERIRNGQGLPIEVLQSMQSLVHAERKLVECIAAHNVAQFQLQRALGWPIEAME